MPTTYTDQFWILDPFAPPPSGTTLAVRVYDLVDSDDDDDIDRRGGDTVNGVDVTRVFPGDTVSVTYADGTRTTVTGTTFYLSSGIQVFTPTDGSVLQDATFNSSTYVTTQGVLNVNTDLGPPCLTHGTLVETPNGQVPVEDLKAGMQVIGEDGAPLTLRMVLSTGFGAREMRENDKLQPVRIVAGALGNGLPRRDLVVSRQHRMLLNAPVVERMFGDSEVLVPAVKLTALPGIYVDPTLPRVVYYHLVFDQHEIIYAEGAATESLYTGTEALRSVPSEAREELLLMFPELREQSGMNVPARKIPERKQQNRLVGRLAKNEQTGLSRA